MNGKRGLTAASLKTVAIVTMLIDHACAGLIELGWWPTIRVTQDLYWGYIALRCIGRLAFPIFCFFIAEGFIHTRSRAKYLLRLVLFGLVSEVPFDWALFGTPLDWTHQNVYFTLALGLLALMAWEKIVGADFNDAQLLRKIGGVASVALLAAAAELLCTDYGWVGVVTVFVMYALRERELPRNIAATTVLTIASVLEIFSFPFWILLHYYNGQRGRQLKYLFYAFYPVHLALIIPIRFLIFQN